MPLNEKSSLGRMMNNFAQPGVVVWIGIRPGRRENVISVDKVVATAGKGLEGDHFSGGNGLRQVTLIQYEHLPVIASLMNKEEIKPELLRRNIAIKGLNLLSLKDKSFRIGDAIFEMSGLCHPCTRMEEGLGEGGYNAVRGHGGITARIIKSGTIKVGDLVALI